MRIKFLAIVSVLFAITGVCFAKDKLKKPVKPVYVQSKPVRIKPSFEKPLFERGSRVSPVREKSVIEKPLVVKRQIDKPQWDKEVVQQPAWDKSLFENKWRTDKQEVYEKAPVEKKADSKVKRGWFRKDRNSVQRSIE